MTYMRLPRKAAELGTNAPRGENRAWRNFDRGYIFTQSLWGAMAFLHNGLITEGGEIDYLPLMPSKVVNDIRYGVERCGLSQRTIKYHFGGGLGGGVCGYVTQILSGGRSLGYYAYRLK